MQEVPLSQAIYKQKLAVALKHWTVSHMYLYSVLLTDTKYPGNIKVCQCTRGITRDDTNSSHVPSLNLGVFQPHQVPPQERILTQHYFHSRRTVATSSSTDHMQQLDKQQAHDQ